MRSLLVAATRPAPVTLAGDHEGKSILDRSNSSSRNAKNPAWRAIQQGFSMVKPDKALTHNILSK